MIAEDATAQLQLMRLVSPALPVGAFAYSRGLEYAIEGGWLRNEADVREWIAGTLESNVAVLDAPVLMRLHRAWQRDALDTVARWNAWLYAARETSELRAEERAMGGSLARLLSDLGEARAATWIRRSDVTYVAMFALAAHVWEIPERAVLSGYLWSWAESQVSAAVRTVPLGHTAGQRILQSVIASITRAVEDAEGLHDAQIGAVAFGQALASAKHETQYSRLFRS